MPLYVRYGNEPAAFTAVLRRLLDGWTQPHNPPGCLDVTVHAHVFGRPFGAIELPRFARTTYREIYTAVLADFLAQSADLLASSKGR